MRGRLSRRGAEREQVGDQPIDEYERLGTAPVGPAMRRHGGEVPKTYEVGDNRAQIDRLRALRRCRLGTRRVRCIERTDRLCHQRELGDVNGEQRPGANDRRAFDPSVEAVQLPTHKKYIVPHIVE